MKSPIEWINRNIPSYWLFIVLVLVCFDWWSTRSRLSDACSFFAALARTTEYSADLRPIVRAGARACGLPVSEFRPPSDRYLEAP
jgi:hypothetical protein